MMEKQTLHRNTRRAGRLSPVVLLGIGSMVAVALLFFLALALRPEAKRETAETTTLRIYCASGIAKPIEQVVEQFNREFGTHVEITRTGGSGELAGILSTEFEAQVADGADVYITADDLLLEKAAKAGMIAEQFPLAIQNPVVAVRADEPPPIEKLADLIQNDSIEFGIASQRAAVGKMVRQLAQQAELLDELESRKKTDSENVMVLAQALRTGSLDAAVIWDTTVNQVNQQEEKPVLQIAAYADPSRKVQSNIALGVVSTTRHPTLAIRFARYLASAKKGTPAFEAFGFGVVTGDVWEEVPEIHLYCGSMFTPVLEERIRQFAKREGINIYPRWEGCGALTSSIQSLTDPEMFPDAYLACDRKFLDDVQQYFEPPITVSTNQIVMAVSAETREKIESPSDVLKPGVRVGICDPELSALGFLTRELFSDPVYQGLYQKIQKQASVTVDVGPTLVSQLSAGGLDVAFVYRTNVLGDPGNARKIRIIEIEDHGIESARAVQPWAISRTTRNPYLMRRLFDVIVSEDSSNQFEKAGFEFRFQRSEPK